MNVSIKEKTQNLISRFYAIISSPYVIMPFMILSLFAFGFNHAAGKSNHTGNSSNEAKTFEFPTSHDNASFHFTSIPDLFNWNISYPQPEWEEAMDWYLGGMKKEGPAFMLNAGDIMDGRWWKSKAQVRKETRYWWGGFRKRFEDKDIKLYIAPGDHEYGDDQGLKKIHLTPVFAEQFASIFNMPQNGPEHMKERAYSFSKGNLAVISVNTFENAGTHLSMTVSGKQLEWFEQQLKMYRDQAKDFIIVQGHVPVFGPVNSKNSSANMLEGGIDSQFWKLMVKYGVDAYLCGEHHRITAKKREDIWQIVHGALWGTQTDVNYLRGSVYPDQLKMELFRFPVTYSDEYIETDHPHRPATNRPHTEVSIPEKVRKNGPKSVGQLIIRAQDNGNQTIKATGEFQ